VGGVIGSIKVVPQRSRANCLPAWTQVTFKERYSQTHTDLLVAVATRLPFTQPLQTACQLPPADKPYSGKWCNLRSSSHFPLRPYSNERKPVAFPPGRLRLATSPTFTGSAPPVNTMGMVVVAALAASAGALPPVATITATRRAGHRPHSFDHLVGAVWCLGRKNHN
jgi:hypothetical protein